MSRKTERMRKNNSADGMPRYLRVLGNLKYRLIVEGIGVGLLAGILVSAFRLSLTKVDEIRNVLLEGAQTKISLIVWCVLLLFFFTVCVSFIVTREPLCTGSGIPQVKGELEGKIKANWLGVIIAKFFGGIMAVGGGLSLGREGPSIQLGAMVGKGFSRLSGRLRKEERLLITCGAGAGLAAAFSAPLAGVVFTLEELHKTFTAEVLLSTMASAITADWVASYIFGLRPVFSLTISNSLPLSHYWMVLILGVIMGAFGVLYNKCISLSQDFFGMLKPVWLKAVLPFIVIVVLAVFYPKALGSGHDLVAFAGEGGAGVKVLLVLLAIKFVFSIFSFGTGAPGGIFLPLLVLGAVTGGLFTEIVSPLVGYTNTYSAYFVILGMAGYFASIVRAPITGIILISEMTGIFSNLLPLAIVSLVAHITAEIMGGVPIYDQLLDRMMASRAGARRKAVRKEMPEKISVKSKIE